MKVLVLCTGNSCRSQMAEGFLRKFGAGQIEVYSAGLDPKGVNPYAVTVMKEVGIDISEQSSKHLNIFRNQTFDYIITVCDHAAERCPSFSGGEVRLHWPFEDPAAAVGTQEEILEHFRRIRDQIGQRILSWLDEIKNK
jgi:arsenate reductase